MSTETVRVYAAPTSRTWHIWRECIPARSQREVREADANVIPLAELLAVICKRCRARLSREGWPR